MLQVASFFAFRQSRGGIELSFSHRARHLTVSLAAAVVAGLLVYAVYAALIRQVELQETVNVVVPKHFIRGGTRLTPELLEKRSVPKGAVHVDMLLREEDALGKETLIALGSGEPILTWKLDTFLLLPQAGESTFQIPKSYLLSLAGGIRAGDLVEVYASGSKGTIRLLPDPVVVASVKSSSNVEVDDPEHPNWQARVNGNAEAMYAARRDANAAVDQINLNLTESEWARIDEACRGKDAKLVLALKAASILDQKGMER